MHDENFEVKAPGVMKLFGEHAAVYGKLSLAAAVGMYATVSVRPRPGGSMKIILANFSDFTAILDRRTLSLLYKRYKDRKGLSEYILSNSNIDIKILPFATMAARIFGELDLDLPSSEITISSEIPMQSGSASSAACSTAFAVALLRLSGKKLDDARILDMARDGERIAHISEGAGRIDTATSYYGGYVSTADGATHEKTATDIKLVLINTGSKKSTAETVGMVRKLYDADKESTEKILNEIEKCSIDGLEALKKADLVKLGGLMYKNHELLKLLGVSSPGLDRAVELCKENGAYGAKLSGGGGGGMAIAIHKDPEFLASSIDSGEFKSIIADIAFDGAKAYFQQ